MRMLMAVVPVALVGCTVGPNYRAMEVRMPARFRGGSAPTTAPAIGVSAAPADVGKWWTTLDDPELTRLVDEAVKSNMDLHLAGLRLREARARRGTITGEYPKANVGASYAHQRMSETAQPFASVEPGALPFEFDLWQVGFDASWEIDVFGGTRRAIEAANADIAAGVEDERDVLVSVVAEVARNYVDLRGYQRQLEITQRNLETQRQTVEVTRNQQQQGIATQLDVSRAAAQASGTEAELPALENGEWQAIHRIAVLLGREPGALSAELSAPGRIPVPRTQQVAIGVPSELLRRRPDIRRAEREIAAATARVGVAVADLFPKFTLNGTFGVQSSETTPLFDFPSRYFNVGPGVALPLFDAGKRRATVGLREIEQQESVVKYKQTVLRALAETEDAVVGLQTEQRRAASLRQSVNAYQEAADVALDLYKQGQTDFLTVLEAQRNLYQQEDALALSERAVTTSLIALYKALGGGWEAAGTVQRVTDARSARDH